MERCDACRAFDAIEREAIANESADVPLPRHALGGCVCEAEKLLDVLALPAWRLHPDGEISTFATRHIGISCQMRWSEFCGYLSRGVLGDPAKYPDPEIAKRQEGGWAGGLYRDSWREHTAFVHTELLTIDIDAHGEIERAAEAFAPFRKAIHSTYKSSPDAPRCRVVLQLAKPCTDLQTYKRAHAALRERLYSWGYIRPDRAHKIKGDIDEGASDGTRLSYAPMYQPGRVFGFLATDGALLDIEQIPEPPKPAPRPVSTTARDRNPDKYREGALRRAESEVRSSLEGQRHESLFKEAASLARPQLGLTDTDIWSALESAALAVMGEGRRFEIERTIRDGIARGRNST